MAKDTFIIYKSFYKPISRLSDKRLGRLFRAIFQYQIDGEATVEEDIEMAFEFFKNQFEIDESKYQGIVERNRSNGRKGVNTVSEKQSKQASGCDRYPNKPVGAKKAIGGLNDNDIDNDNKIVYDNNTPFAVGDDFLSKIGDITIEQYCMTNGISEELFYESAKAVLSEWNFTGVKHQTESDARQHLLNQIRIKLRTRQTNETKQEDRFSKRRGVNPGVNRAEDYSDTL